MSNGYNITCDPGALGMQTCYVNVNTPTGCTTGAAGCTTSKQEVIGYADGQPVSKGVSSSPWMAWVPQLTTLNNQGQAYQPYGGAGIPYSLDGGSLVKWNPTDMQALAYLDSAPGAGAREAYQERTCNPLWSNVFGCKEGNTVWIHNDAVAEHENGGESFWGKLKSLFSAETKAAESDINPLIFVGVGSAVILGCILIGKA
jgi:hypothetical protein